MGVYNKYLQQFHLMGMLVIYFIYFTIIKLALDLHSGISQDNNYNALFCLKMDVFMQNLSRIGSSPRDPQQKNRLSQNRECLKSIIPVNVTDKIIVFRNIIEYLPEGQFTFPNLFESRNQVQKIPILIMRKFIYMFFFVCHCMFSSENTVKYKNK